MANKKRIETRLTGLKSLIVLGCLALAAATAWAADGVTNRGGVLFYAGFDGRLNADYARGDAVAIASNGTPVFVEGVCGQAVELGRKEGCLWFAVDRNVMPAEGSIEMWVRPKDWDGNDNAMHVFFEAMNQDRDWLLFYKYASNSLLLLMTPNKSAGYTCADHYDGVKLKRGVWSHLLATWTRGEFRVYLNGVARGGLIEGEPRLLRESGFLPPKKLSGRFSLGDKALDGNGGGVTAIDEVYIYDRPLSKEEATWVYARAKERARGSDVPERIEPPVRFLAMDTDLNHQQLQFYLALNPRWARLQPSLQTILLGTDGKPVPKMKPLEMEPSERFYSAIEYSAKYPYATWTQGTYTARFEINNAQSGKLLAETNKTFAFPGTRFEWEGNQLGITDTPPPPWTPVELTPDGYRCWGREYQIAGDSLIRQVVNQGRALLQRPVSILALKDGMPVTWRPRARPQLAGDGLVQRVINKIRSLLQRPTSNQALTGGKSVTSQPQAPTQLYATSNAVSWVASADSELGLLEWRVTGEYDGFTWCEATLYPNAGAAVDKMELRFSLKPERATMYYMDSNWSLIYRWGVLQGFCSNAVGEFASTDHALYTWLGDDEGGLQMCIGSDEPWQEVDRKGMMRLERTADSVDLVWSFAETNWALPRPWKVAFGIQATPVKDCAGWRKWRFSAQKQRFNTIAEVDRSKLDLTPGVYYAFLDTGRQIEDGLVPRALDPKWFRNYVDTRHAGGMKYIQYTLADYTSPLIPEWRFRLKQYYNGEDDGNWVSLMPSQDWIDFHTFTCDRFIRDYDQDGIYYDLCFMKSTGGRRGRCSDLLWYMRNGVRRKLYPVLENRELYRRLYTLIKAYGAEKKKDTWIIAHAGTEPFMAIHSFADMAFQGEDIKDNYEQNVPLELLRVRGQSKALGLGAYWIPQRPNTATNQVEQSRILLGRLLLHDVQPWNTYIDGKQVFNLFELQNRFGGIVDTEFLPYWSNGAVLGGQTEQVKASAYRSPRPDGGSLISVANISDQEQKVALTLDTTALRASSSASVAETLGRGTATLNNKSLTVTVPAQDYVVVWIK